MPRFAREERRQRARELKSYAAKELWSLAGYAGGEVYKTAAYAAEEVASLPPISQGKKKR